MANQINGYVFFLQRLFSRSQLLYYSCYITADYSQASQYHCSWKGFKFHAQPQTGAYSSFRTGLELLRHVLLYGIELLLVLLVFVLVLLVFRIRFLRVTYLNILTILCWTFDKMWQFKTLGGLVFYCSTNKLFLAVLVMKLGLQIKPA